MSNERAATARLQAASTATDPVAVYDHVTKAWELLLGQDLHFGLFDSPQLPLPAATAGLTRHMAHLAQLRSDLRLLDVGCGIGGPACWLAQELRCYVTGISTSNVGIDTANRRAAAQGLGLRAQFLVRDAMHNGLGAESFDRAWVMESSHLMERKDLLLAESARVLRPGGILILCDVVLRKRIPFQNLVKNLADFENLNEVFGKQHIELLSAYAQLAEERGLTVLRTEDASEAVLPTMTHWAANAERYRGEVRALVGEEYLARFTLACAFLQRLWKEELLGYAILVAQKRS